MKKKTDNVLRVLIKHSKSTLLEFRIKMAKMEPFWRGRILNKHRPNLRIKSSLSLLNVPE